MVLPQLHRTVICLIVSHDLLARADGFLNVQSRHRNSVSTRQITPQRLLHQGSAPVGVWGQLSRDWSAGAVSSQANGICVPDLEDSFSVLQNTDQTGLSSRERLLRPCLPL